jgi:predicted DNA-binding transcriptional regulator AlpA
MKSKAQSNAQPAPNPVTRQASKILTVQQVADLLQIPKSSVYEKTRSRPNTTPPLPCRRLGKYLRFDFDSVMRWFSALPESGSRKPRSAAR